MSSTDTEVEDYRYTALQIAVTKFGSSFNSLSIEEQREAEKIAKRQLELQNKILASAEATNVVVLDEQIDQAVGNILARYANGEEFDRELHNNGLDQESLRYSVAREKRVEAIIDRVNSTVTECTETEARIYYYLHPDKFQLPETREASHILITVNPDFPENTQAEAKQRIEKIASRLQKKPTRFAEQAMKHSECPTAMEGGTLGRVKRGVLFPSLDEVLFQLKAGTVSDVVESPMGFHVLMCNEIYPHGLMPINEAIPHIIEKINDRNQKAHLKSWLSKL